MRALIPSLLFLILLLNKSVILAGEYSEYSEIEYFEEVDGTGMNTFLQEVMPSNNDHKMKLK